MIGAAITIAFFGGLALLVIYGLSCDLRHWLQDRRHDRAWDLEHWFELPAVTPDHERENA